MTDEQTVAAQLEIKNELGLHARPAAMLVQAVAALNVHVTLSKEDLVVDGKSIMGVLTLAAEQGCMIGVSATGPQAHEAVEAIRKLVEDGFGED